MYLILKIFISAAIIALFGELSKKSSFLAAFLMSLPLTSIIALCWSYYEHRDVSQIITLSKDILLLIIPSMTFFIALPILLEKGLNFIIAMLLACVATGIAYLIFTIFLKKFSA